MAHHTDTHKETGLAAEIFESTAVKAERCYQCGKCSAGCPIAEDMEYPPSLVMRMLQTKSPENDEKILRSNTIWLCVTCEMCISRCPMEIDIPKAMDFMREKALKERKVNPGSKHILDFHKSFLSSIEKTGRLYEMGLIAEYKMRTFRLMQDVMLAPKMFSKGKLHLLPEMVKNKKIMVSIFSKTLKNSKEE